MKYIATILIALAVTGVTHVDAQDLATQIVREVQRQRLHVEALDAYWGKRGYIREGSIYRKAYRNQERNTAYTSYDPVRAVKAANDARLASNPWGPGGEFANQPKLSPQAIAASQGNTAANQWERLGAYKK